jgi:hypothetical protein
LDASSPGGACCLVIRNAYQWIGNPSAAGFVVYLDRRRAGVAPLGEDLTVRTDPGVHQLRVRFWWFLSPRVSLTLEAGQTRRFKADIPRSRVLATMRGLVDPFHSLSVEEVS